jgi:hypothetical protein
MAIIETYQLLLQADFERSKLNKLLKLNNILTAKLTARQSELESLKNNDNNGWIVDDSGKRILIIDYPSLKKMLFTMVLDIKPEDEKIAFIANEEKETYAIVQEYARYYDSFKSDSEPSFKEMVASAGFKINY